MAIRKNPRSGLPLWWNIDLDIAFLKGVARWGIVRTESMIEDDSLPFKALNEEFLAKKQAGLTNDEKFWMKETIAMRRFEILCEAMVPTPASKKRKTRGSARNSDDDEHVEYSTRPRRGAAKSRNSTPEQSPFNGERFNDGSDGETDLKIKEALNKIGKLKKQARRVFHIVAAPDDKIGSSSTAASSEFFASNFYKKMNREVIIGYREIKPVDVGMKLDFEDEEAFEDEVERVLKHFRGQLKDDVYSVI